MKTREEIKEMKLGHLWQLFYDAHRNTSFVPEKRADSRVIEYSELLEADLKELGENTGNYEKKFIDKLSVWMRRKSNCLSSMITGPSNFPTQRNMKANRAEHNAFNDFMKWRDRYFEAVKRVPTKSPEDELGLAETKLEVLTMDQEEMKEINKELRKNAGMSLYEIINHLKGLGFKERLIKKMDEIRTEKGPVYKIPSYALTNNNARIKAARNKVQIMVRRIERKKEWEDIVFDGGRVTIEDDRLKIYHDEKPSREIINEIKGNGFRWSPHWGCWCRKHTGNAVYALRRLSFLRECNVEKSL